MFKHLQKVNVLNISVSKLVMLILVHKNPCGYLIEFVSLNNITKVLQKITQGCVYLNNKKIFVKSWGRAKIHSDFNS